MAKKIFPPPSKKTGFAPRPGCPDRKVRDEWHITRSEDAKCPERKLAGGGFTLFEVIVSMSLFIVILLIISSIYSLSQKSYNKGANEAELSQNMRVAMDRISRELRQSTNLVTAIPPANDDPDNPPAEEIFFQDGHDISEITYIRYFLNGSNLMRRHSAYYFDTQPDVYVPWNSTDQYGGTPSEKILDPGGENRIVGEYFDKLQFWGNAGLINIYMELKKNENNLKMGAKIFMRN